MDIYDAPFISRPELWSILRIFGVSRHACYSIYQKQRKAYCQHLTKNGFISPGMNALPNKWLIDYLKAVGITKESIKAQFCRWLQKGDKYIEKDRLIAEMEKKCTKSIEKEHANDKKKIQKTS